MPLDRLGVGKITLPHDTENTLKTALEEFATRVDDNINYLLAENIALKARVAALETP
jgi:hypothetical protein